MDTETKAEYPCAQKDVISVLETVWANYVNNIAPLSGYKPAKYNAALAVDAKGRIAAARALPDFQARSGKAEELLNDVRKKADLCLNGFQLLKGYIDDAFKGENEVQRKPNYEEAGQNYYRDASREDWESVQGLCDSMKGYITEKLAKLTTDGNMPATFQADVNGWIADFETFYGDFKEAEQTQVATATKLKALNACYEEGMDMMKDAQRVFAKEPEVKSLFVFAT